jgi:hypothetical protein
MYLYAAEFEEDRSMGDGTLQIPKFLLCATKTLPGVQGRGHYNIHLLQKKVRIY